MPIIARVPPCVAAQEPSDFPAIHLEATGFPADYPAHVIGQTSKYPASSATSNDVMKCAASSVKPFRM